MTGWQRPGHGYARRLGQRHAFDAIEFVIVNVETTGWSPAEAGVAEIGAVRMSGGQIRAEFHALVNPAGPSRRTSWR